MRHLGRPTLATAVAFAILVATGCESDGSTTPDFGAVGIARPSGGSLTSLQLSAGSLNPSFSSSITSYTATVPNSITSTTVTAGAPSGFTIAVNGTAAPNGSASAPIGLVVGNNTITVVGSSASGTPTRTYTIVVNRAAF